MNTHGLLETTDRSTNRKDVRKSNRFEGGRFTSSTVASPARTSFLETNASIEATPQPELSEIPTLPPTEGDALRHILIGTPGNVRQTIHLLHTLRYVENMLWSPLVSIPNDQLIITPKQGDVMSILIRHMR